MAVAPGVRHQLRQRGGGRRDLSSPRRDSSGDRAGGGPTEHAVSRPDQRAAERSLPPADRRQPHGRWPGSARSKRPWTGATTSCRRRNGGCYAGSRSSRAGGRSKRRRPCARATASGRRRCSICCRTWSTNPWSSLTRMPLAADGIAFSRPSVSTDASGCCAPTRFERLRDRHFTFFFELAQRAEPKLHGPDQVRWLQQLGLEHDNLRVALGWCSDHRREERDVAAAGVRSVAVLESTQPFCRGSNMDRACARRQSGCVAGASCPGPRCCVRIFPTSWVTMPASRHSHSR